MSKPTEGGGELLKRKPAKVFSREKENVKICELLGRDKEGGKRKREELGKEECERSSIAKKAFQKLKETFEIKKIEELTIVKESKVENMRNAFEAIMERKSTGKKKVARKKVIDKMVKDSRKQDSILRHLVTETETSADKLIVRVRKVKGESNGEKSRDKERVTGNEKDNLRENVQIRSEKKFEIEKTVVQSLVKTFEGTPLKSLKGHRHERKPEEPSFFEKEENWDKIQNVPGNEKFRILKRGENSKVKNQEFSQKESLLIDKNKDSIVKEFERVGEKIPAKETDDLSGESDDLRKKGHRKDKIYHQQSNQISPPTHP